MKNSMILTAILVIVVGVGGFYGGMQYQKNQASQAFAQNRAGNVQGRGNNRLGNNMRPVSGEVISQDSNTVTVKLSDGSSKIIVLSDSTSINKSDQGSKGDLKVGEKIAAFGTANSDGSVTAQNIQINPRQGLQSSPSADISK